MGIIVRFFRCFYVYFFMVITVMSDCLCVFIPKKKFLYSVNVYVFIPILLFIIKNVYA